MPAYPHIQIGDYKQGAYNKQLAAKQPLSVVVPIIIYHGKRKWVVKPFSNYFGDVDKEFHRFMDPYEYYLTNLQDYSDEMIQAFSNILLIKGLLALKHYYDKAYVKRHFVELVFVGYDSNHSKEILDFIRSLSVYLSNISGGITKIEIYYQIEQLDDNLNKENMYNFIDELLEKGEKKGIEQGVELGKKMSIYQVHLAGHDIESLSRIFALPIAEIIQIIEEMKKMKQAKRKN